MRNNNYLSIDYFRELKTKAYSENESFDEFIERIAEKYFPGRGLEWRMRYAFSLHFYGLCVAACENCKGVCPHHGHRYFLRIKKGSAVPIPWASMEICPRFRESIDRDGRRHKPMESLEPLPEQTEFDIPLELFEAQGFDDPKSTLSGMWPEQTRKSKQQDLFDMEEPDNDTGEK